MKIFRTIIQLTVIFSLIFALGLIDTVKAASLEDLQNKKDSLQKEIAAKKEEAERAKQIKEQSRKEKEEHELEVVSLDGAISRTRSEIEQLEDGIRRTEYEIKVKEEEISSLEAEIAKLESKIDESIRVIYEDGERSAIELILGEKGISGIISDAQARAALIEEILHLKNLAIEKKNELEKKKAELEEKRKKLEKQKKELNILKGVQETQRSEQNKLMQKAAEQEKVNKEKELEARSDAEELKKEFSKVAAEAAMMRRLEELRRLGKLSPDERVSSVGFMWPVTGRITARLGERTPFQVHHTGLDTAAPVGTPIRAAAGGQVTIVTVMSNGAYTYGYGRYVKIEHNVVTESLYAHLNESFVSPGQRVERGDIIGTIGMTGWTTGPHLHFEIRLGGVPEDPLLYLP